jgi:hypothetical protein
VVIDSLGPHTDWEGLDAPRESERRVVDEIHWPGLSGARTRATVLALLSREAGIYSRQRPASSVATQPPLRPPSKPLRKKTSVEGGDGRCSQSGGCILELLTIKLCALSRILMREMGRASLEPGV